MTHHSGSPLLLIVDRTKPRFLAQFKTTHEPSMTTQEPSMTIHDHSQITPTKCLPTMPLSVSLSCSAPRTACTWHLSISIFIPSKHPKLIDITPRLLLTLSVPILKSVIFPKPLLFFFLNLFLDSSRSETVFHPSAIRKESCCLLICDMGVLIMLTPQGCFEKSNKYSTNNYQYYLMLGIGLDN